MLVLLVADLESTHWLGPILAIGIAVMLAAAFTLLPALLSLLGERAFWPTTRSPSESRGSEYACRGKGTAERVGRLADLVRRRSRPIILAVFAPADRARARQPHPPRHDRVRPGRDEADQLQRGTEVLDEHFPPGIGSPLTAVVKAERGRPGASQG